ncbi:MAG: undecaprenyldiphospho-muramoylpentapeptide beta-N-acetylglucosaminyltransferase [Actinomycetota bacterium]|nr:undecaprenyldiphospho-muramoylpentapeptide beta-N-acetylglucosaminyltransferase [Actinomycetota bacterium]
MSEVSMQRRVMFGAGGTGGHVYPAIAVARALTAIDADIEPIFVGTRDRLEGRLVPEAGFTLHHIDAVPVPRRASRDLLRLPLALRRAVRRCTALLRETSALAAVTFGGYVSFPLARASRRLGLPLVVHEQNALPGLANKLAGRWADRVAVSFPGSADHFPHPEHVAVTGNPVREEILALDEASARLETLRRFQLDEGRRTLLVFGGSQGARRLNEAVVASHSLWKRPGRVQILHVTGRALYRETAEAWAQVPAGGENWPLVRCVEFMDDMAAAYTAADVVLCRSGATSIAEITALGKASVLVPYPHATGDHQRYNALALERAGGARVIFDPDLDGRSLVAAVERLFDDDDLRSTVAAAARAFGRRDAADNVARLILGVLEAPAVPPITPPLASIPPPNPEDTP